MELGRIVSPDAVRALLALARREFDRSVGHTEAGRAEFYRFTEYASFAGEMLAGEYKLWGLRDSELRAVAALRGDRHISMLFVQCEYQGNGMGRVLCETMIDEVRAAGAGEVTVNSTPETVGFYRKMGFNDADGEQQRNGIRFVPMSMPLR